MELPVAEQCTACCCCCCCCHLNEPQNTHRMPDAQLTHVQLPRPYQCKSCCAQSAQAVVADEVCLLHCSNCSACCPVLPAALQLDGWTGNSPHCITDLPLLVEVFVRTKQSSTSSRITAA
jgi:hypothetical protein